MSILKKLKRLPLASSAIIVVVLSTSLSSCRERESNTINTGKVSTKFIQSESLKANQLYEQYYQEFLQLHPELQTRLGNKDQNDRWNEFSEEQYAKVENLREKTLKSLKDSLEYNYLDEATALSYQLLKNKLELEQRLDLYKHYNYPVSQMRGMHTQIPSFLINVHQIENQEDAQQYILRIQESERKIQELILQLKIRERKNIIPPKFLFPKFLGACQNIIKGYPLEPLSKTKQIIYKDFEDKVNNLEEISEETRQALVEECGEVLRQNLLPAYQELMAYLSELEQKANDQTGVWKFEDGEEFYRLKLKEVNSKDILPEEVYELGMSEVKRIHQEMKVIMQTVKFEGNLQDFFQFMREDKQFYFPNTPKGKEDYLKEANAIIDSMRPKLNELFIAKPKAELRVKAVEAFREKAAGKAFYEPASADGSRPGTYYVNTYDMTQVPRYQMEALAYHEAIPGHHMQISIAQELDNLPNFRRYLAYYTAYIEGWGLYSEYLPRELGFYKDPYANFGRLAMELWRACRLVVDVGIHQKKWTREKAIAFYKDNTPNAEGDCIKMVDRHIVMPAQATSYKIGMISIIELRDKAKESLGDQFDIRQFHQVILENGALPLDVLEDKVNAYIEQVAQ